MKQASVSVSEQPSTHLCNLAPGFGLEGSLIDALTFGLARRSALAAKETLSATNQIDTLVSSSVSLVSASEI